MKRFTQLLRLLVPPIIWLRPFYQLRRISPTRSFSSFFFMLLED
jgi:hypothetical protein